MKVTHSTLTKAFPALAMACAFAASLAEPAGAQTANNDITGFVSPEARAVPFSALRTFSQSTGTHRYRLNCDFASTTGTVWIDDLNMVAIFVPTAY